MTASACSVSVTDAMMHSRRVMRGDVCHLCMGVSDLSVCDMSMPAPMARRMPATTVPTATMPAPASHRQRTVPDGNQSHTDHARHQKSCHCPPPHALIPCCVRLENTGRPTRTQSECQQCGNTADFAESSVTKEFAVLFGPADRQRSPTENVASPRRANHFDVCGHEFGAMPPSQIKANTPRQSAVGHVRIRGGFVVHDDQKLHRRSKSALLRFLPSPSDRPPIVSKDRLTSQTQCL